MSGQRCSAVVLAAGKGTRMKSRQPKVLHPIAGRPMIAHVLDTVAAVGADPAVVVVGPGMEAVAAAVAPHPTVVQRDQAGTADAVKAAREPLSQAGCETVLVLFGDTPFIEASTVAAMLEQRQAGAGVVVLGMRPDDPFGYGRLVLDQAGELTAIVEQRDADAAIAQIPLCNSGVMAIDAARLFPLVDGIDNANAKGEFYLTDVVAEARGQGLTCAVVEAPAGQLLGINDRADLAMAERLWQEARRRAAMEAGATLADPSTVWFSHDTVLGQDVTIGQNVVFGPGVEIADNVEIRPFSHLEGAVVQEGAVIGPFARLRPGAKVGPDAHVGNFVELKNTVLGIGAKANHLSYLGDAKIGAGANIGAGTITCNYDGFLKHRTEIGAGAFIGSNAALVAPVTVGDGAIVGAGSVVTRDVAADALSVARGEQTERPGAAARYRETKTAEKAARQGGKG